MGNCKIDGNYEMSELYEEVNINDNENGLIKIFDGLHKKVYCNQNNSNINNNENILQNKEYNDNKVGIKKKILGKKMLNLNMINSENNNNDELVIITPRNNNNNLNNINNENYANEITDEYTIKNETLVYINEISNKGSEINENINNKHPIKNLKVGKKQPKKLKNMNDNKIRNNSGMNNSKNKNKMKINNNLKLNNNNKNKSRSNIHNNKIHCISKTQNDLGQETKKIMPKNNYPNYAIQNLPSVKINDFYNQDVNNENNNLNKMKSKSKKNSKVFNKSFNDLNCKNFGINQLLESFQFSENMQENNPQSSTLEKQNYELRNLLLQKIPIINSEEILPNIERKTYKEDLDSQEGENRDINNIKNSKIIYQLLNGPNQIINDNKDNYNLINQNIKMNRDKDYKNRNKNNIPIFKKKTDFHIRNKSYNNIEFFKNNLTNDYHNDNNYFSLFNNSTNLSINFIHNKYNKSAKNLQKIEPLSNTYKNAVERNKSTCNQKVQMKIKNANNQKDKKIANPYFNYNNFNKKGNPNKKVKNRSNFQKVKHGLSNSRSYNNIFQANQNKYEFNNTNSNINNLILSSEQYRDIMEIYMPKIEKKSLICKEIINKPGNKYIFSYEKLDNFDIEQVLYDGVIYKVIDNLDNNDVEYKFLERYFQISKNCFRYFDDINEAIKEKEKPLVQFDIRHIKNIEIFENNFLGDYKINGNKNINILFCIYIKDNNDFFVFAHHNKIVGNNIINILQFLIRYYEDNY